MKKLIYLFILILVITSCSSDDETQIEKTDLTGKWNWVSSCGGFTGDCWYPSEDHFKSIEFKNDFTYIRKINDVIDIETNYSITDTIINGSDKLFKIEFQNGYSTYFMFTGGNLSIEGGDFWEEYERIIE